MCNSKVFKKISAIVLSVLILFGAVPFAGLSQSGALNFETFFVTMAEAATAETVETFSVEPKPDYSNLTVYQYLAKLCTNNNYRGVLNDYGTNTKYPPYTLMNDYYMNPDKASKARIIFNEFNSATDYKTTRGLYELLTFDLSNVAENAFKLESYYSAILLSLVDAEMANDNFIRKFSK